MRKLKQKEDELSAVGTQLVSKLCVKLKTSASRDFVFNHSPLLALTLYGTF